MPNYATKTDLKNVTHVDTSSFALKTNLANLKTKVDKLDTDKLVPTLVDLSKLIDVAKNDFVKKTVYDQLVEKIDNIDSSNFVKTELENKFLILAVKKVKKTNYNTEITELENNIPDISNLATKTALTTVENKITDVSSLIKNQTITPKLQKLKINLIIIIMANILILQSLIL